MSYFVRYIVYSVSIIYLNWCPLVCLIVFEYFRITIIRRIAETLRSSLSTECIYLRTENRHARTQNSLSCRIYLGAARIVRLSTTLHVSLLSLPGSLYCIRFEVMFLRPLHSFTYFSLQTQHVDTTSSKTSCSPHAESERF